LSAFWIPAFGNLAPRVVAFRSLSGDPLANVRCAAFQRGTSRFAPCQEPHRVLIDELDLLEVQSESTLRVFAFDHPSEVREMLGVDATTQREAHDPVLHGPLYPQHRNAPMCPIAGAMRAP